MAAVLIHLTKQRAPHLPECLWKHWGIAEGPSNASGCHSDTLTNIEDGLAPDIEEREADLQERESALADRLAKLEAARPAHLETVESVCQAADVRDVEADDRDRVAAARDRAADVQAFTSPQHQSGYGADLPARRHAALDRVDAKGDRTSAAGDRALLGEVHDDAVSPEQQRPE